MKGTFYPSIDFCIVLILVVESTCVADVATRALKLYKEFFGVSYTLPKIDLVAVPDFYIEGMENWGLLTFRSVLWL